MNCAALPEELLESELFGHVRGAFTGAVRDRAGWFEKADGSTIFLDEINDMSTALQGKLLRILQNGEYSRVGSSEIQHCDVRVVAATSKNMKAMIKEGQFREELYYRLNVIDIWLPPLRERKSDIPLLIQHFLKLYIGRYGKPHLKFSPQAEMLLMNYDFPGNIRELENIIKRAEAIGINREDLVFDCVVMANATNIKSASIALEAQRRVAEKLGASITGGYSNVSFGMPNRNLLNIQYITMGIINGLCAPITDPLIIGLSEAIRAADFLAGRDPYGMNYISHYRK